MSDKVKYVTSLLTQTNVGMIYCSVSVANRNENSLFTEMRHDDSHTLGAVDITGMRNYIRSWNYE